MLGQVGFGRWCLGSSCAEARCQPLSRRLFITVLRRFSTNCPALKGVMATTQQRSVQRPRSVYSPSVRRKRSGVTSCMSDSRGEAAPGARQTVHDVLSGSTAGPRPRSRPKCGQNRWSCGCAHRSSPLGRAGRRAPGSAQFREKTQLSLSLKECIL